jgi:hypothetical protein
MNYTVVSPVMYYVYFESIDDSLPLPASFDAIKTFNTFANHDNLTDHMNSTLKNVISSIEFEAVDDGEWSDNLKTVVNLYAHIKATRELTNHEKQDLLNFLRGQYSDGWGENGFEIYGKGVFNVWWPDMPALNFVI